MIKRWNEQLERFPGNGREHSTPYYGTVRQPRKSNETSTRSSKEKLGEPSFLDWGLFQLRTGFFPRMRLVPFDNGCDFWFFSATEARRFGQQFLLLPAPQTKVLSLVICSNRRDCKGCGLHIKKTRRKSRSDHCVLQPLFLLASMCKYIVGI
jgi:hypothetical protein